MVAHFLFYGGRDKLHAPLATLLQKKIVERNVAKEPNSQIKILEPIASQKNQIYGFWLQKSQSGNPVPNLSLLVGFTESGMVENKQLGETLTVVLE